MIQIGCDTLKRWQVLYCMFCNSFQHPVLFHIITRLVYLLMQLIQGLFVILLFVFMFLYKLVKHHREINVGDNVYKILLFLAFILIESGSSVMGCIMCPVHGVYTCRPCDAHCMWLHAAVHRVMDDVLHIVSTTENPCPFSF